MRLTVRDLAIAVFWLGACFAALRLAAAEFVPILSFVVAVACICYSVYVIFSSAIPRARAGCWATMVPCIVAWNSLIYPAMLIYPLTVGQLVVVAYEALFGDIQSSYGAFAQVAMSVGYVVVTIPATLVAVRVFDKLSGRTWSWRRAAKTTAIWEAVVLFVLVSSNEVGFAWQLHLVGQTLLGTSDDVYSFQNVALPRIVAWLIETTPVVWTALWVHSKLA